MTPALPSRLSDLYERLHGRYGPQHWWPADTPFEVLVGAVLTQNTSWRNVARAIENLKAAGVLELAAMRALPRPELAELIRPAGYYNLKERRLRNLLDAMALDFGGELSALFGLGLAPARQRLLAVNGVGPETADSILLYAGGLASFVIDAYTKRVLTRHGLAHEKSGYDEMRALFMDHLPHDAALFNEYHALFVTLCKRRCAKGSPHCEGCPAQGW